MGALYLSIAIVMGMSSLSVYLGTPITVRLPTEVKTHMISVIIISLKILLKIFVSPLK